MKGKLFGAVVLVVILTLVLVVPASAGKPIPYPTLEVKSFTTAPSVAGADYTARHTVYEDNWKGYFLVYTIAWHDANGNPQSSSTRLALKTNAGQTLTLPSSGYVFKVNECSADAPTYKATETIGIYDRKGAALLNVYTRDFYCRLTLQ